MRANNNKALKVAQKILHDDNEDLQNATEIENGLKNALMSSPEDMNEEQRGALVEIGMAFAFNKPVYAVGTCKTIQPNKISDVAFTHFSKFHWVDESDLLKGFEKVQEIHYQNLIRKAG